MDKNNTKNDCIFTFAGGLVKRNPTFAIVLISRSCELTYKMLGFLRLLGATHAEETSARLHPQPNLQ
jgi:hypothetical protein